MRTFYIFSIKKEITILLKDTPYNLFKTIENLYYSSKNDLSIYGEIYQNLFSCFDVSSINTRITNLFQNYKYYSTDGIVHYIYNKYRPENTTLRVYRSHIILKSDVIKPTLLVNFSYNNNLFVCDFKNKDYFWLDELKA